MKQATTDSAETGRQIFIFNQPPAIFDTTIHIGACYVEAEGKILLLQYGPNKLAVGLWGVPGGKVENGENTQEGAQRELFEETGIFAPLEMMQPFTPLYIRKPEVDFVYHLFGVQLEQIPPITLSAEHQNYKWLYPNMLQTITMVEGAEAALAYYFNEKGMVIS